VIVVDDISKAYPIYANPKDMLFEMLLGKQRHDNFWALKNVSFSVPEKSRVGVIGPNGSGKSTLLQIITGNLQPSSGKVTVDGKISGMLSLNSVLNPNETGINNIRFNLILNGAPRQDIDRLTEEIIEFTELGQFIYSPVRTYSSGMNARLAFAIATAIEPEILIVDEVLSVGDAYFVGKATQRMTELCEKGKALLFVSHSIADVRRLCDKVIWMENGAVRMVGPAEYVIKQYEEDYRKREDQAIRRDSRERLTELSKRAVDLEYAEELVQFRLVSGSGDSFHDTYYVRDIRWRTQDGPSQEIDLAVIDGDAESSGLLDLFSSEWGRLYDHRGIECRVLEARTGRNQGGHLLVPPGPGESRTRQFNFSLKYRALGAGEPLVLQYFDYQGLRWCDAEIQSQAIKDDWVLAEFTASLEPGDAEQVAALKEKVAEDTRPDVEIGDVDLVQEGVSSRLVGERTPFLIRVHAKANRPAREVDICLKIMRSDGVYVFWQSSGLTASNLLDIDGRFSVEFDFSENLFGAGDYLVSAVAANGWNYPDNYPHGEVFDRKVSCLKFRVQRELDRLDFGLVNQRVPVKFNNVD